MDIVENQAGVDLFDIEEELTDEQLASKLRTEVLPKQQAHHKASKCSNNELIHRLTSKIICPVPTEIEMRAYRQEAARRISMSIYL